MITELDNEHSRRFGTLTDHYQIANIAFTVLGTHARARYQLPHPTPPAQAMPDVFKNPADPVAAYRRYYRIAKGAIARWERGTAAPDWWRVEPLGTTSA